MPRWEQTAALKRIDGTELFELLAPLSYTSERGVEYVVLEGFHTDGASIPRLLRGLVGSPIGGEYTEPAVLHDALYRSGLFSLRRCDVLMREAMIAHGTPEETINSIMLGLGVARLWRRRRPVDPMVDHYLKIYWEG